MFSVAYSTAKLFGEVLRYNAYISRLCPHSDLTNNQSSHFSLCISLLFTRPLMCIHGC